MGPESMIENFSSPELHAQLAPMIRDLAWILGAAGVSAALFQRLKLPVIVGYLAAGVLVNQISRVTPIVQDLPSVRNWGEIGVVFLMFTLGLEFSFRKFARLGLSTLVTAVIELTILASVGYGVGRLIGMSPTLCIALGAMISMSSTMIIAKTLDDLGLKTRRFATRLFPILVVEDLAAILWLVILGGMGAQTGGGVTLGNPISRLLLELVLIVGTWFVLGYLILPPAVRALARACNDETLMILGAGLCLLLASLSGHLGFSVALGAFVMGSILAECSESERIREPIEPVRDLFSAIFFVSTGMLLNPHILVTEWKLVLLIVLLVVLGKSIFVTLAALITGQSFRTSFQMGTTLAQLGEFSLIIAAVAASQSPDGAQLQSVVTCVVLITAITTPLLVRNSHTLAVWIEKRLPLRLRETLSRYAQYQQQRADSVGAKSEFHRSLGKWLLNALLATSIHIFIGEWLIARASPWVAWFICVALSLPSIVGLLRSFDHHRPLRLASRLATTVLLSLLVMPFLPLAKSWVILLGLGVGFLALSIRALEEFSNWFTEQFIANFDRHKKTPRKLDLLRKLAPWDAHLVRLKIHPNSRFAGQTLFESELRSRFGLNIVVIQRGMNSIIAPLPTQVLFPKDELLVLGNDESIERVRPEIERPPGLEQRYSVVSGYRLHRFVVEQGDPWALQTIRESQFRSRYSAMVVGIERGQSRILNPETDERLQIDDVIWVVGPEEFVREPSSEIANPSVQN